MRRYYGLDLAEALYGPRRLAPSRLRTLIEQLPQESAYAREQGAWWTPELELLATIAEVIGEVHRLLQGLGGVKQAKNPVRVTRPKVASAGAEERREPMRAADYRRAFFNFEGRA